MMYSAPHAVDMHNVTKKFTQPVFQPWMRSGRLPAGGAGKLSHQVTCIVALQDVSLEIEPSEILAVYGSHGSGKSTFLRLLSGMLAPDAGELRIFGQDVARQPLQAQRMTNRLSVEASFFKTLSAFENMLRLAHLYGVGGFEAQRRVIDLLQCLGLEVQVIHQPLEDTPNTVQQIVSVACALLCVPRLLLLDEPTMGLSAKDRQRLLQAIKQSRDANGTTVILTAQDRMETLDLAERVLVLENGHLREECSNIYGGKNEN